MKKKLFLLHSLLSLITIISLLLASIIIINNNNKKDVEKNLNYTLNVARNALKSSSSSLDNAIKETNDILSTSKDGLRLTIIDKDGTVLFDSNEENLSENHLDREEIKNLGTVVIRYSSSLNTNYMYLAGVTSLNDTTIYIRVAVPMQIINSSITNTLVVTIIIFIIVLLITLLIDFKFFDYSMKPLKHEINRLNYLVSGTYLDIDKIDVDSLKNQIDSTKVLIETKIDSLEYEKEKLNYIINTMKQGLIIVDLYMNVVLVNDYIKKLFNYTYAPYDSLLSITIIPEFNELYRKALKENDASAEFNIDYKHYILYASRFKTKTLDINNEGICFTLFDITLENNLKKAKSDFFANASHELKSPLTSIIGYSEMIKNGFLTKDDEINDALDRILFESKRMNEIVIEMLELSRLETSNVSSKETLSIRNTVLNILNIFKQNIESKGIEVILSDDDFNTLISSEDLYSLIKNVLENAIRYNKDNGKIYINIDSSKKQLSIKDTGIGIDDKYKDRIFERFFRIDKARSRKLGGTGLGLSIVKYICINNSIKIELDSKKGEYTTFKFTFSN